MTTGFSQIVNVKDKETGQPLDLVTLTSDKPRAFALTNGEGQAEISRFKGAGIIEIRIIGYQTLRLAYQEIEKSGFEILMEQGSITLNQVVISATRWNQDAREVPARIVSLSPRKMALGNPQTAADLLNASGEVFIQKSQQGGGSPMIRGFATNRLLYTVDGVRMNTAIFRSGNLQNVISLDPLAMDGAEVIFGPVSLIYGSDAIGGVMSFRTLNPKYSLTGKPQISGHALTRYASANNEITGHFDVNVGWNKWAMVTSFSHNHYGDLRMGREGPDDYLRPWYVERIDSLDVVIANPDPHVQQPSGYSQNNLMQKISFKPSENWELQYGFHYSVTTGYARYDRLLQTRKGLPRSAEWNYGPQEWMMNNLTVSHSGPNSLYDQFTLRLAWQNFAESRINRDFNKTIRYHREEKVSAGSVNADFLKTFNNKHTLYYGLEWVLNHVKSTGEDENIANGSIVKGPSRYPQSDWLSLAGYISYMWKINTRFLVQGGIRYSYFSMNADFSENLPFYPLPFSEAKVSNGAVTGNLGIVYNPTEKWSLVANLSTGFRAPNVDDLGKIFESEPGSVVVPNPGLKPEYAYNAEVGAAKVFGKSVKIDLTGYYTWLSDAMVRRDFTLNGQDSILYDGEMSKVQAIQNASFATVYGIQAGLEVKLPAGFGITSQFNFQKGEEELDDGTKGPLRHAAPWYGITHLTFNAQKLELDLYAYYNGAVTYDNLPVEERGKDYMYARDENGKPWSPDWYTLNFKALYQITSQFSVSAGVENITDKLYRPYTSGMSAPGRNFIIALRAKF